MLRQIEPWRVSKNVLKIDETCRDKKPHRLRMVSLTRMDCPDVSIPDDHTKSEVVYQCVVCKKYQVDRYVYPKMKRVIT